jgi:hypothetical protein
MTDQTPRPVDFVAEAHSRGLLTFFEVAKLLDLLTTDVLDLMFGGEIAYETVNNKPCASLAAVDAYRRRQITRAS